MILKEDMKVPINELMADLEKHVKKITGYEIKLIEKVMNEDIRVPLIIYNNCCFGFGGRLLALYALILSLSMRLNSSSPNLALSLALCARFLWAAVCARRIL